MKHFLLTILWLPLMAMAAIESRQFDTPEQQAVYESLTNELRCLVCQNQTIADSNAELAGDLRRQVYEMLEQGRSRDEIVQFMTDRYGDFVLYNPPLKTQTLLLWWGPGLFLLAGIGAAVWVIRRKKSVTRPETDPAQTEKLAQIRRLMDTGEQS